jgi:hypothetical protein
MDVSLALSFDRARRELGEGSVGRCEHGERSGARKRLDEPSRLDRRDQCVEAARFRGDLYDVLHWCILLVICVLRRHARRQGEQRGDSGDSEDGALVHGTSPRL